MSRHFTLPSLLALFVFTTFATSVDAQVIVNRRASNRDLKAMEEYYDDLEDFYEDRNPRLAKEAEKMEKYYEDLRKGRRVVPPVVSLPRVQVLLDSSIPARVYQERSVLVRPKAEPQNPGAIIYSDQQPAATNERWQAWGATPPAAKVDGPALTPHMAEAYRVPTDGDVEQTSVLLPPEGPFNPAEQLGRSAVSLHTDLQSLASESPNAATQWMEYLAVPTPSDKSIDVSEFYNTSDMRALLGESLKNFDRVAEDPAYVAVNQLASFVETRNSLRALLAWLDQQPTLASPQPGTPEPTPAEELPTPPGN